MTICLILPSVKVLGFGKQESQFLLFGSGQGGLKQWGKHSLHFGLFFGSGIVMLLQGGLLQSSGHWLQEGGNWPDLQQGRLGLGVEYGGMVGHWRPLQPGGTWPGWQQGRKDGSGLGVSNSTLPKKWDS